MGFENVINLHEVALEEAPGNPYYRIRHVDLAGKIGARELGFGLWELAPGSWSCPYHFHHAEEELFLVLAGRAMLRQPQGFREVREGDLMSFPTGEAGAHQLHNHTDEPFRMLTLSNRARLDVCEYPDSGKILIRGVSKMFRLEHEVPYMEGEEDPRVHWPSEHSRGGRS